MKYTFGTFFKNFLKCGLAGWCMEILFTSADSLRRRDMTLKGTTSLWMFPTIAYALPFIYNKLSLLPYLGAVMSFLLNFFFLPITNLAFWLL